MTNGLFGADQRAIQRAAVMSPCGVYRYSLCRWWAEQGPYALWIMLNPSTADANQDDATIRRCIGFTRRFGYGGLIVVNLFALRATDPRELTTAPDPIGPENDNWIQQHLATSTIAIAAWGAHPFAWDRATAVARIAPPLMCLGTSQAGYPRHPLYLAADTPLIPYTRRAA